MDYFTHQAKPPQPLLGQALALVADYVASVLTARALAAGYRAFAEIDRQLAEVSGLAREQDELYQAQAYDDHYLHQLRVLEAQADAPAWKIDALKNSHEYQLKLKQRSETELLDWSARHALNARVDALRTVRGPLAEFLDRHYVPNEREQLIQDADEHQGLGIFEVPGRVSDRSDGYTRWFRR